MTIPPTLLDVVYHKTPTINKKQCKCQSIEFNITRNKMFQQYKLQHSVAYK